MTRTYGSIETNNIERNNTKNVGYVVGDDDAVANAIRSVPGRGKKEGSASVSNAINVDPPTKPYIEFHGTLAANEKEREREGTQPGLAWNSKSDHV